MFGKSLAFALFAGLAAPVFLLATPLQVPSGSSIALFTLVTTAIYLMLIAPTRARGVPVALLATALAAGAGWLLPGVLGSFVISALTIAVARSVVLYRASGATRTLAIEVLVLFLSVLLARMAFAPTALGFGAAVWVFYLVQSTYFVLARPSAVGSDEDDLDPFEAARRRLERLLS